MDTYVKKQDSKRKRKNGRRMCGLLGAVVVFGLSILHLFEEFEYLETTAAKTKSKSNLSLYAPNFVPRVKYSLQRNGNYTQMFQFYSCNDRGNIPASRDPGVLDFTTTIQLNNLRLILLGSSVGVQVASYLDEMLLRWGSVNINDHENKFNNEFNRSIIRYEWKTNVGVSMTRLGNHSVFATHRFLGMLGKRSENGWRPNQPVRGGYGGYRVEDVNQLMDLLPPEPTSLSASAGSNSSDNNTTAVQKRRFDAMIFQIPSGWLRLEYITEARLNETAIHAHKVFGVNTIIFFTLPFTNNVKTVEDFNRTRETNDMIRRFCQNWKPGIDEYNHSNGPEILLAMDYDALVREMMEDNARGMGYDPEGNATYWLERVPGYPNRKHQAAVAQVCSTKLVNGTCPRLSYASLDGMHLCLETSGGRLAAGVACQLGCVYNHHDHRESVDTDGVQGCSLACNQQFMSLNPILYTP